MHNCISLPTNIILIIYLNVNETFIREVTEYTEQMTCQKVEHKNIFSKRKSKDHSDKVVKNKCFLSITEPLPSRIYLIQPPFYPNDILVYFLTF